MTRAKNPVQYDSEKHCGGKTRAGGKCTRPKGWGTGHVGFNACKLHGGCTETGEKAGELAKAENAARRLGVAVVTNPYDALNNSLAIENGFVEYFQREVERIDPDCTYVRPTSILRRPLNEGKEGEDPGVIVEEITEAPLDLHIAIKALERWLAARDKTSKIILDAGLAERILKYQEEKAQDLFVLVRGIVLALGFTLEDPRIEKLIRPVIEGTAEEDN